MGIDVGKNAKHMGRPHPKTARVVYREPPKKVLKASDKSMPLKRYGIAYEYKGLCFDSDTISFKWEDQLKWYSTEKQRNQALEQFHHKYEVGPLAGFYRNPKPVHRLDASALPDDL